jgi:hypothetical protein
MIRASTNKKRGGKMASLLARLDRQAERLLNVLDADLHPTLLRAATGEAFRDSNPYNQRGSQSAQQDTQEVEILALNEDCEPDCDGGIPPYPVPLRKVNIAAKH